MTQLLGRTDAAAEIVVPEPPLAGMVRFIRYGFMPNRLRYCGGDENRLLFDHAVERVVDGGLKGHLQKFTGALPYLQLISRANGIMTHLTRAWWTRTGSGTACWTTWRFASSTIHS